jgi:hypothetical protein
MPLMAVYMVHYFKKVNVKIVSFMISVTAVMKIFLVL